MNFQFCYIYIYIYISYVSHQWSSFVCNIADMTHIITVISSMLGNAATTMHAAEARKEVIVM